MPVVSDFYFFIITIFNVVMTMSFMLPDLHTYCPLSSQRCLYNYYSCIVFILTSYFTISTPDFFHPGYVIIIVIQCLWIEWVKVV